MGPLAGLRVLELEAIGPGPFCGMMLADMGADVLLVDRPSDPALGFARERWNDVMLRGRRSITLDLKREEGVEALLTLVERADVLIEGFRPGVLERLGLGPDVLLARNPRLVVGRMTGWGQDGPLAARAGHDIDYIALSGALHAIGRTGDAPVPPLNLIGDFGGGGLLLAFGVVCALVEAKRSGHGQVVDAAMVEGASLLTTMFWGMRAANRWTERRGENVLDGGAPWYECYETRDGKHIAIGAIEAKFYAQLLALLELDASDLPAQHDRAGWPTLRERFVETFKRKTREEWVRVFDGSDACFAPVLSFDEATRHPHNVARNMHVKVGDVVQPAPAPKFSRTPGEIGGAPPERGARGGDALRDWGYSASDIAELRRQGVGWEGAP
ncbi:MAG TPA: CaiB/BaiF CoA-transferase family protein [Casimicrobiaceae bacterium]|nr:CaiB/BaiF CoA-transferase family protein [Casimicrobiaceae bacterium]